MSQQTKFDYVIQKLDKDTVKRVRDLVASPPPEDQYKELKERLLACFKKSRYEELQDFNDVPPLGDRRPTELMDDLLSSIPSLQQNGAAFPFISFAFLNRLPDTLRSLVAAVEMKDDLHILAEQADRLWKAAGGAAAYQVSSTTPFVNTLPVDELADNLEEVSVSTVRRNNRRRPAGQQQQQNKKKHAVHFCQRHFTYGDQAFECEEYCKEPGCGARCSRWSGNGRAGGRRN